MTLRQQAATEALAEALYRTFVEGDMLTGRIFTDGTRPDVAQAILAALPEGWTLTNHLYADLEAAARAVANTSQIDLSSWTVSTKERLTKLRAALDALTESEEAS